jgi:hypothetical protein
MGPGMHPHRHGWGRSLPFFTRWITHFCASVFLNTTKDPPSPQSMLMTMGPALILPAASKYFSIKSTNPFVAFDRVPFFTSPIFT